MRLVDIGIAAGYLRPVGVIVKRALEAQDEGLELICCQGLEEQPYLLVIEH